LFIFITAVLSDDQQSVSVTKCRDGPLLHVILQEVG